MIYNHIQMQYWFVFFKDNLLLKKDGCGGYTIPYQEEPPIPCCGEGEIMTVEMLGGDMSVKAYTVDDRAVDDERYEFCDLRKSFYKLPKELYLKAGKCRELLYWDAETRFCGACGAPMQRHTGISKRCTKCGKEVWPQLATAVIVLVSRGDEALLVHAHNFKSDFYGLVAGFVETGETLEEAVAREVREETNLTIKNIRYHASQPWPYPCGLMIGFYAEYKSGRLQLQRSELRSGGWYSFDSLPQLPEKLSIARKLIDHWQKQKQKEYKNAKK